MVKFLAAILFVTMALTQNNKRIIMLFADDASQKELHLQQHILAANKQGCAEREIVVKTYTPKDATVYKKYHIRKGFTVVLIGKDGGEKLRSHAPVSVKKLFALIDAMPMRKEEISHAGGYEE